MLITNINTLYLLVLSGIAAILLASCTSTEDFSGYSYDPEGVTETTDKETNPHYKRTIGIKEGNIWVSNEFAGARLNDFYQIGDSHYSIIIKPERDAINNSPWYAFKIWGDTEEPIDLQLEYEHGGHRYIPKLSTNGKQWRTIDADRYEVNASDSTATLSLNLSGDTLWISAQELYTYEKFNHWADSLSDKPWVSLDRIGYSHLNYPITKMSITEADTTQKRGVLVITGRLHPPEVTGSMATEIFIEELVSDSELAAEFRNKFEVWAYPFANPDGVQKGHWRYNARGVDLNRDWEHFNQPEPRAIRDDLLPLRKDSLRRVYYGIDFHSTNTNIFYPINRDIKTFPDNFTYDWIQILKNKFPHYPLAVEPFPPDSPITKNWIFHTFGADAVTYEVSDEAPRDRMRGVVRESARIIMQQLLDEWEKNNSTQGVSSF